jgi:hypothetical protein
MSNELPSSNALRICRVSAVSLGLWATALPAAEIDTPASPAGILEQAVLAVCPVGEPQGAGGEEVLVAGGILVEATPLVVRGREVGWRRRFALEGGGDQVLVEGIAPDGVLRRVRAEYHVATAAGLLPKIMVLADGSCLIQTARRLVYDVTGKAEAIEALDATLSNVEVSEPLNPPVPVGLGTPGIPVAIVDAGVNYLLPYMAARLARDPDGHILGFDYWDMDDRPFDANPARSPFFPQRHGTRTASLLLHEAPVARVVPYRYPRPAMERMADLVEDAAQKGVLVVNLSLGGNRAEEWQAFQQAAEAHPEMLFVVSAGNNGRDLDSRPVFPAALTMENLLTVSSSEPDGRPAQGSNWGRTTVDLMTPAENVLVTDFQGRPAVVSGSSYAAARVSALGACLLADNPEWRAAELKTALLERTQGLGGEGHRYSVHGFLPDLTGQQRGACPPLPQKLEEISRVTWSSEELLGDASVPAGITHRLTPTLVVMEGAGWEMEAIREAAGMAVQILAQCGVEMSRVEVLRMDGPERFKVYRNDWSSELISKLEPRRPAVFFVRDTLQEIAFDAEAIGRSNGRRRPQLIDTVWMTAAVSDPGVALAHELYHVLANSGRHDTEAGNLMYEQTSGANTVLRASQCLRMLQVGTAFNTLKPVE